ncbi:hypothetical protein, partial [Agrobacterium tomkonis]|uniref:hypothetical protein n=1 Tax=Agrobacterium tomkonis TaxID=1183410 RepID=UPI001CD890FB
PEPTSQPLRHRDRSESQSWDFATGSGGEKKYAAMPGAYPKASSSSQTRESKTAPKAPFS